MRAAERASLALARAAVAAHGRARALLGLRLRGVGRLLRRTAGDHVISYRGLSWALSGPDAASYFMMLVGRSNEPETLAFLRAALARVAGPATFVDVGSNLGEFLIDVGREPNVVAAVGFEPNERCVATCRRSIALNGLEGRVRVVAKAASDRAGRGTLHLDRRNPLVSSLVRGAGEPVPCETTTLDEELAGLRGPLLLLVDVEGAEALVLRGARRLLAEQRPLVVFEHNATSRRHVSLEEVRAALPAGYEVFRLRGDGRLDRDLSRSWNCVAVAAGSAFAPAVAGLVAGEGE